MTTGTGCTWTAVSHATAWLTITNGASDSGSGTVSLSVEPQHHDAGSRRNRDHRRSDLHGYAERRVVHVHGFSHDDVSTVGGRQRIRDGDDDNWLRVDRDDQRVVDHHHLWCAGHGQWSGQLHGCAEHGNVAAPWQPPDRGTYVRGRAGGQHLHLRPDAREQGNRRGRRYRHDHRRHRRGCPWTATTNRSWISVSGTGTAAGSASYTVSPNTSGASRDGTITIGTRTFRDAERGDLEYARGTDADCGSQKPAGKSDRGSRRYFTSGQPRSAHARSRSNVAPAAADAALRNVAGSDVRTAWSVSLIAMSASVVD